MKHIYSNIIVLLSLCSSIGIYAISLPIQASQLDGHVHGLAEITIVIEDKNLIINLASPTANLVGFEHQATTLAEHLAVERAQSILEKYGDLFVLNGGRCILTTHTVDFPAVFEDLHDKNQHAEHQHPGHQPNNGADHHDKDRHDAHQQAEQNNKQSQHSEVVASYQYHCENTAALTQLTVQIFDQFPGVEKVKAMWITENNQASAGLNAINNNIHLR